MHPHSPHYAFVRGLGGTGTSLTFQLISKHPQVSALKGCFRDEGQYCQRVFPKLPRPWEMCLGDGYSCPAITANMSNFSLSRNILLSNLNKHWIISKSVLLEKTPDVALTILTLSGAYKERLLNWL